MKDWTGYQMSWQRSETDNPIVSGDLQEQFQCLKLCEDLCVHTCAYFTDMKLFTASTRNMLRLFLNM